MFLWKTITPMRKTSLNCRQGKYLSRILLSVIYRIPFAKVMQIPADDFFLQIKDKYTRHEKSLWMKFDAAFIKLPKGFE
jgi:hypothetical protein